jgi:hypothetical protein
MTILNQERSVTQIREWFASLDLEHTVCKTERLEGDGRDELPSRIFHFMPAFEGALPLDVSVADEGDIGMGIMHPSYSKTVYAWGFEGSVHSIQEILELANQITVGAAEIVFNKFGAGFGNTWLEVSGSAFQKIGVSLRLARVRCHTSQHFLQTRIASCAWT